ncbi:hypothetical protein V8E54_001281 [Elaphomyces granulatus]
MTSAHERSKSRKRRLRVEDTSSDDSEPLPTEHYTLVRSLVSSDESNFLPGLMSLYFSLPVSNDIYTISREPSVHGFLRFCIDEQHTAAGSHRPKRKTRTDSGSCLSAGASPPGNGADTTGSENRGQMTFNKRQKRVTHPDSSLFEQAVIPRLKELEYEARWHYFLHFDTYKCHDTICKVFPGCSVASYSRQKILELTKNWKSKSIQIMEKLVAEELDLASQNPGVSIASITAQRDVTAHFLQTFRPDKFFTVFYWIKKTIDYEGASPLGKYYMSNIFANLAGYVKLYLDSKSDDNRQMTKETILDFWIGWLKQRTIPRSTKRISKSGHTGYCMCPRKNPKNQKHQLMNAPSFLPTRLAKSPRQRHLRHVCH